MYFEAIKDNREFHSTILCVQVVTLQVRGAGKQLLSKPSRKQIKK
jgi:hypothetical protein